MRRLLCLTVLTVAISTTSGCTFYDALFGVFQGAYSGGGASSTEKLADYNSRIEAYGSVGN